jgi:hypothetical protein
MTPHRDRLMKRALWLVAAAAVLALSPGCTVRLISDYDEVIDAKATELRSKLDAFLSKLERTAGTDDAKHEKFASFYEEVRAELSSMLLRAKLAPKSETVQEQITLASKSVDTLEEIHKKFGVDKEKFEKGIRPAFDTQFGAIIRLQKALKRSEKVKP